MDAGIRARFKELKNNSDTVSFIFADE